MARGIFDTIAIAKELFEKADASVQKLEQTLMTLVNSNYREKALLLLKIASKDQKCKDFPGELAPEEWIDMLAKQQRKVG